MWPRGQAVKTAASHAVNVGSIPARVTKKIPARWSRYFSFYLYVGLKENATYSLNVGGVFVFGLYKVWLGSRVSIFGLTA